MTEFSKCKTGQHKPWYDVRNCTQCWRWWRCLACVRDGLPESGLPHLCHGQKETRENEREREREHAWLRNCMKKWKLTIVYVSFIHCPVQLPPQRWSDLNVTWIKMPSILAKHKEKKHQVLSRVFDMNPERQYMRSKWKSESGTDTTREGTSNQRGHNPKKEIVILQFFD